MCLGQGQGWDDTINVITTTDTLALFRKLISAETRRKEKSGMGESIT